MAETVAFTCPDCRKYNTANDPTPGRSFTCAFCPSAFEFTAERRLKRIPDAVPAPTPAEGSSTSEVLAILDQLEALGHRMIIGIGRFLTQALPAWLARQLAYLGRIAVKAARVLAVLGVWFAVTWLPLLALVVLEAGPLPVLLVLTWTALAVIGSVWGMFYVRQAKSQRWRLFAPRPRP